MTNIEHRIRNLEGARVQRAYANGGLPPFLRLRGTLAEAAAMKARMVARIRATGRFNPSLEPGTIYCRDGDPCTPEELAECERENIELIDRLARGTE